MISMIPPMSQGNEDVLCLDLPVVMSAYNEMVAEALAINDLQNYDRWLSDELEI